MQVEEDWEQVENKGKGESVELTQREVCEKRRKKKWGRRDHKRQAEFGEEDREGEREEGEARERIFFGINLIKKMEKSKKKWWEYICPKYKKRSTNLKMQNPSHILATVCNNKVNFNQTSLGDSTTEKFITMNTSEFQT